MFITLLAVTFVISLGVSVIIVAIFGKPIDSILQRIISDEISQAWVKYLKFAVIVVGVSSGVRIWELEKYIMPRLAGDANVIDLTRDRWVLEVYRTVIGSLQGIAWLLLIFFIFAMIAFVFIRISELKRQKQGES
jgi:large-conductance mechanosensitive channel